MINNSNKAVIVGAGWLGSPLADQLSEQGWQVVKTSRYQKKQEGWAVFNITENICDINLLNATWFFCIPPGRTPEAQNEYSNYLKESLVLAKKLNARRFIFCSTTGVYPSEPGKYVEGMKISPSSDKQKRLLINEQLVSDGNISSTIVRLGGLIGNARHPGRFLSGKTLSTSSMATVNMLHQKDAIAGLIYLANIDVNCDVVNLVTPHHPTKGEFYNQAAIQLKLPAPSFAKENQDCRVISSEHIQTLGFTYKYTNLFDALNAC